MRIFTCLSVLVPVIMAGVLPAVAAGDVVKPTGQPNVLFITVDDMNYDSAGVTGCKVPDITPNIDKLAADGMRFVHAHVTIAVCQPNRSVLMTGRYPYRNGAEGFEPIDPKVPTLQESLRAAGYINGIFGKTRHLQPEHKFCWDVAIRANELSNGRDPAKYYKHAEAFFQKAKDEGKPFFLMANSHDPHRPFAGSDQEKGRVKKGKKQNPRPYPNPGRIYKPDEIVIPGILPDIPEVRKEIAEYFSSVHRCDETVGELLRALAESGLEDNTIVMILSDNGMALPYAKTNVYFNSTRTPWIVRWPVRVEPGTVDSEHFISSIDFMPTILEAAGAKPVPGLDGKSFLPLLEGKHQKGRDHVYTVFHQTAGKRRYEMRSVQNARFGYIYNPWSDGETIFLNESQSGRSFKAMKAAAEHDEKIAARVKLFQYRVPEELFDYQNDPCALKNLIDEPTCRSELDKLRKKMLEVMRTTSDPLLEKFQKKLSAH
ncbi:MAG: sulfatase [Planctomycetota bacterium]|nr:MAG: sulfatase [Planctomycetota bacterium]